VVQCDRRAGISHGERGISQITDPTTIEEAIARLKAARTGPELEALAQLGAREQNRWGSFALTAPRRLGEWLNRTPRLKGRPKKESIVDSLPSLADLGITDRHLAAWALKVAAVPQSSI
jgi:squalene cyclase